MRLESVIASEPQAPVRLLSARLSTRIVGTFLCLAGAGVFLAALNARIDRTRVTIGGLGIEPEAVLVPPRAISTRAFMGVLAVTLLSSGAILWLFATLARR